jgi:valine--pyruvate aminotransferase
MNPSPPAPPKPAPGPDWQFSDFGDRFRSGTGTYQLMADLGAAANQPGALMLGGGNPARIPAMEAVFRRELARLAASETSYAHWGGNYSAPEGDLRFRTSIADLLRNRYGWPLTEANIALSAGSQSGFFMLLNIFGGQSRGAERSIWLPITPEYIGYADVGLASPLLQGAPARVEDIDDRLFKYRLHPRGLEVPANAGAVCLSRPTNPTGNVLDDKELRALDAAARAARVPLILDCAYGLPFPGIVFTDAQPFWNENVILCLSLSKLGLPGLRTGIVVARPEIVRTLGAMMGVMNLAPPSFGPALIEPLLRNGELLNLAGQIRSHYEAAAQSALAQLRETFRGLDWKAHVPEGAFFLWLRFPGLKIPSWELYERLKKRNVFVLSGHHFFPADCRDTPHYRECLRVNYAQPPENVRRGFELIAEEVRALS